MLDLGFLEDVERILALTPSSRQTALFSATMPPEIRRLADQYLYDPVTIKVKTATLTVDTVEQFALEVAPRDKHDALVKVIDAERPDQAIVFVRTKIRCDQLYRTLRDRGMNVRALHGDMTQGARDGVMISFKGGQPAAAGRHRRGRPRARHLGHLARHQLRRPHLARRLRAPDRAHRPGRPQRPRHHLLRAPPAARDRGDRAPRRGQAVAVGQGRPRRADAGHSRRRGATPSRTCRRNGERPVDAS